MRNVLVFVLLIGAGFAVVGFFAHGMARLSGITPATTGSARADMRKPAEAHKNSADAAARSAAAESPPPPYSITAPTFDPMPHSVSPDSTPLPSEEIASSPVVSELKTVRNTTAAITPPAQSTAPRVASSRSAVLAPPKAALVIPPSLSTVEAREAQCRSLSAYLSELDTMARTRSEPGVHVWIQNQRTTTWERQTELRC